MCFFCKGAVSAGGNVSVHGSAARPSRSVEPAGTQPVCSGHHGHGVGKGNCYIYCSRPLLYSTGKNGFTPHEFTFENNGL